MPRLSNTENLKCGVCGRPLISSTFTNTSQIGVNLSAAIGPYINAGPGITGTGSVGITALCCPSGDKYYLARIPSLQSPFEYSEEFKQKIEAEAKSDADKIIKSLEQGVKAIYVVNFGFVERIRNSALDSIKIMLITKKAKKRYAFSICIEKIGKSIFNWRHIIVDYNKI